MATFRETREALLHAHDQQLINDEEFVFFMIFTEVKSLTSATGITQGLIYMSGQMMHV